MKRWILRNKNVAAALLLALLLFPPSVYAGVQAVNYDNGGAAMQVSLYGKGTVAGDTPILATSGGQFQSAMYATNASPGDTAVQSGDVNNAASILGALKSLVVGRYDSTLPTLTNGRFNALQTTSRGELLVAVGANAGGPAAVSTFGNTDGNGANNGALVVGSYNVGFNGTSWDRARTSTVGTGQMIAAPPDYSYIHIAAGQATTVVKGSKGFLHAVCFNSAATATNVTTLYDNASGAGNVIAIPNAVAATVPNCITYDLTASLGIVIITATANGSDMTVSYR